MAVEHMELCAAEALANVVIHAYGRRETGTIRIACECLPDRIVLQITDNGIDLPAELLQHSGEHPFSGILADLPECGFGWFLIHDLMDEVAYRREGGRNELTLMKRVAEPSPRHRRT